jgi:hypothetical protein
LWIKSTPIDTLLLSPPETREICKTTPKNKQANSSSHDGSVL